MDQNTLLGASGAGETVDLGGTPYTFSPVTQSMEAELCAWLKKRLRVEASETAAEMRRLSRQKAKEARELMDAITQANSDAERSDMAARMADAEDDARALEFDARDHLMRTDEKIASGACAFGSWFANQALGMPDGAAKMVHLMLLPKHPSMTLAKVGELLREYEAEITRAVKAAEGIVEKKVSSPTSSD